MNRSGNTPCAPGIFLTVPEVATVLKFSQRTVWRWIKRGDLVAHRFGGSVRILKKDLDTFIRMSRFG